VDIILTESNTTDEEIDEIDLKNKCAISRVINESRGKYRMKGTKFCKDGTNLYYKAGKRLETKEERFLEKLFGYAVKKGSKLKLIYRKVI
jgi:hypothetical protein